MNESPKPTAAEALQRLIEIVRTLRSPGGCPWDRAQTFESLQSCLLEEAHEAAEAVDERDADGLAEELGDLLTVIALYAQIGSERGETDLCGVLNRNNAKLIRRHPHVFGGREAKTVDEAVRSWENAKRTEAGYDRRESALDGIPKRLPALSAAVEIQKKAERVLPNWDADAESPDWEALLQPNLDTERTREAIGGALYALAETARAAGVDPEAALRRTNAEKQKRFRALENQLRRENPPDPQK